MSWLNSLAVNTGQNNFPKKRTMTNLYDANFY